MDKDLEERLRDLEGKLDLVLELLGQGREVTLRLEKRYQEAVRTVRDHQVDLLKNTPDLLREVSAPEGLSPEETAEWIVRYWNGEVSPQIGCDSAKAEVRYRRWCISRQKLLEKLGVSPTTFHKYVDAAVAAGDLMRLGSRGGPTRKDREVAYGLPPHLLVRELIEILSPGAAAARARRRERARK